MGRKDTNQKNANEDVTTNEEPFNSEPQSTPDEIDVTPKEQEARVAPVKKELPQPSSTSDYVLVGLKHPQGISFPMPDGSLVTINGNASHLVGLKKGVLPDGGFGLTKVKTDAWEYIKKTYAGMDYFKCGLIFTASNREDAESMIAEFDEIKSGFEPIKVGKETSVANLRNVERVVEE